ncbi:hypothetical protein ASD55_02660 [Rhodanobacter sp. Root561]|uniref:hypothetical protein n=1 Tax=Rhodanobacter sp. Root561 TaxID=1736560 RepID=UPI0006FB0477|nr:hypothetical protein [Rhodanobacter sp. Root561]KQZ79613.1 hypothetical protein ASD55_02660 [Rhodanobacter sp. Root561]
MHVAVERVLFWATSCGLAIAMGAACAGGVGKPSSATLWDELKRFAGNKVDMLDAYEQLHSRRWEGSASNTYQLLSMSDAMLGRYDQAQQEMYSAFRNTASPLPPCPNDLGSGSFDQWLMTHAGKFDLVMINEAHNQPMSRALIYQMLPIMRRLGFSILALEALPDEATTAWINQHGYVPDEAHYGFYLREPIEGEVVRRAKRLGFTLASYDIFSKDRELDEARNLARILKEHPGQKVFVVAGYDHVRRMDGRMAELLPKLYGKPFLSIDQLGKGNDVMRSACAQDSALGANEGGATLASMRWKLDGRGTDVTVFRTGSYSLDRAAAKGSDWLSLGGDRWRRRFSTGEGCGKSRVCLVEARGAGQPADAVPVDRYLALEGEHFADLYLHSGNYVMTYRSASGAVMRTTSIAVHESSQPH